MAAAAPGDFADDEFLVSRELEEIAAASRRQHEPSHHHQHFHAPSFFNPRAQGAAVGCEVCGRGSGGINSPVSTAPLAPLAPLAASGGGGSSGLIAAPAPAWCLYCGCTQPLQSGQCSQCSPHRRAAQALQRPAPASEQHRGINRTGRGYYEAEDAASRYPEAAPGGARNRSGQYYSPPGTSYTIVETNRPSARDVPLREIGFRPITAATRASSQSPPANHARGRAAKHHHHTNAISPEQVIRMLGANHHPPTGKHHARHDTHPPTQNIIANLPVRTVSMSRPADSPHGFGICVKGGRETANRKVRTTAVPRRT